MRQVIRTLTKDGKDINEVLDMPYHFLIGVLEEKKNKSKVVEDSDETERILDNM